MAIELLKPKDVMKLGDGMHNDGRGLYLQVSNGGKARSWIFRYAVQTEVDGVVKYRDRQMGLGPVYDTDIHQARKLAHDYRELRRLHIDPIEHRDAELMEQRLARGSKKTFGEIVPMFMERYEPKWAPSYHKQAWRWLNTYVLPKLGDMHVGSINVEAVHSFLKPIQDKENGRGGAQTAEAIRIILKQALDYAGALGLRTGRESSFKRRCLGLADAQACRGSRR